MSDIILTPTVVDEIEIYVSDDGKISGLSISGLARLCGVNQSTMSKLVNNLETGMLSSTTKCLEPLCGKAFTPCVTGVNGAKIVDHRTVARIVRFYAYESTAANDIAKHSFDKFSEIGIDKWLKQSTGFKEDNTSQLVDLMKQMYGELQELKVVTNKYANIKTTTISIYPGLDYINTEIEDGYLLESASDNKSFTAVEYLSSKGITLDRSAKQSFCLMLSATYKSIKQTDPIKVKRKDKKGNLTQVVNGFTEDDIPILDIALKKMLNSR